jgi:hypothetical protein
MMIPPSTKLVRDTGGSPGGHTRFTQQIKKRPAPVRLTDGATGRAPSESLIPALIAPFRGPSHGVRGASFFGVPVELFVSHFGPGRGSCNFGIVHGLSGSYVSVNRVSDGVRF